MKLKKQIRTLEKLDVKDIVRLSYGSGKLRITVDDRTTYIFTVPLSMDKVDNIFGEKVGRALDFFIISPDVIRAVFDKEKILAILLRRLKDVSIRREAHSLPDLWHVKSAKQDDVTLLWSITIAATSLGKEVSVSGRETFTDGLAYLVSMSGAFRER